MVMCMAKVTIYIPEKQHKYLIKLAGMLTVKLNKRTSVSGIIQMLIELLLLIHKEGIPDDLGYLLQEKNKKILELLTTRPE